MQEVCSVSPALVFIITFLSRAQASGHERSCSSLVVVVVVVATLSLLVGYEWAGVESISPERLKAQSWCGAKCKSLFFFFFFFFFFTFRSLYRNCVVCSAALAFAPDKGPWLRSRFACASSSAPSLHQLCTTNKEQRAASPFPLPAL